MKRISILIFILPLNIFGLYSQAVFFDKGQIITKSNDTIEALVELTTTYGEIVLYKFNADSKIQEIEVQNIKVLVTPYNSFYNISANNKELLFRIVVNGKNKLFETLYAEYNTNPTKYKFTVTRYNPPTVIYALKLDEEVYIINNKKEIDQIIPKLDRCPKAKEIVTNKRFKLEDLKSIVVELNYCN